jgi:hypothetical protein
MTKTTSPNPSSRSAFPLANRYIINNMIMSACEHCMAWKRRGTLLNFPTINILTSITGRMIVSKKLARWCEYLPLRFSHLTRSRSRKRAVHFPGPTFSNTVSHPSSSLILPSRATAKSSPSSSSTLRLTLSPRLRMSHLSRASGPLMHCRKH